MMGRRSEASPFRACRSSSNIQSWNEFWMSATPINQKLTSFRRRTSLIRGVLACKRVAQMGVWKPDRALTNRRAEVSLTPLSSMGFE